MTRVLLVLLAAAATALVAALPAAAKEVSSVRACGESACQSVGGDRLSGFAFGGSDAAPPPPGAYYRLDVAMDDGSREPFHMALYYVPSRAVAGMTDDTGPGRLHWFPVEGASQSTLAAVTRDLHPYPAPATWPAVASLPPRQPAAENAASGVDWTPWIAAAAGALALAGLVVILARRRSKPAPEPA